MSLYLRIIKGTLSKIKLSIVFVWIVLISVFLIRYLYDLSSAPSQVIIQERIDRLIQMNQVKIKKISDIFSKANFQLDEYGHNDRFITHIYENGTIKYWSNDQYAPHYGLLHSKLPVHIVQDHQSLFIVISDSDTDLLNQVREYFIIIPFYRDYPIDNQYLKDGFLDDISAGYTIRFVPEGNEVITIAGENYPVEIVPNQLELYQHYIPEYLLIVLFFVTLVYFSELIATRFGLGYSVLFLVVIVVLRLFQLYFFNNWLLYFTPIFDPLIFASKWWIPNSGELFIQLLILVFLSYYLFRFMMHRGIASYLIALPFIYRYLFLIVLTLLAFFNLKLFQDLIWNLSKNSQIELNITKNIVLTPHKLFFYGLILLSSVSFFFTNHWVYNYFIRFFKQNKTFALSMYLASSAMLIVYYRNFGWSVVIIITILWIALAVSKAAVQLKSFKYLSMLYILLIVVSISFSISWVLFLHHTYNEQLSKQRFGNNLLLGNDILGEYYLNQLAERIESDPYIRTRFLNELLARNNIREKITRMVPTYLEKYQIDVHMYDPSGFPYGSTEKYYFSFWEEEYQKSDYATSYTNIFFRKTPESGRYKYVLFTKITQFENVVGYLILEFTLKKFINSSFFPSILQEQSPIYVGKEFDHAVYKNGVLNYSQGDFSFPHEFSADEVASFVNQPKGFYKNQMHLLVLPVDEESFILIVSHAYGVFHLFSNASFYFILFLLLAIIVFVLFPKARHLSFSLSNRLMVYLAVGFVLPVIVISAAILNLLNQSNIEEIERSYLKQAKNIAENYVRPIQNFLSNEINRTDFNNQLFATSGIIQADLFIYNPDGRLITSNRQEVIDNQLLSSLINPQALRFIKSNPGQSKVYDESIGSFNYKSAYVGIYSYESGNLIAILGMPFFNTKNHLHRQRVDVFTNLIIIFSATFLLSVAIGHIGFRRVTEPIRLLSKRFTSLNYLTELQQPIDYEYKDEIGLLVREYNMMLVKLKDSREELEKVQKETAWKEIARQVAHEIKNPLTPMKLKIQQMQRETTKPSREFDLLQSLLVQVDTLASIADSFSAFTQMPAPKNELFDFSSLVKQVCMLYSADNLKLDIDLEERVRVFADPKLFSQILNNLIVNAIQAMDKNEKILTVSLKVSSRKMTLSIEDNGCGINQSNADKVFNPYFSTKSQGSGIGLPLAKKGIEQAGGNIWFESDFGKGTTFYVSLPLA